MRSIAGGFEVTTGLLPLTVSRGKIGFMAGLIEVPDDFDRMGAEEIEMVFGGNGEAGLPEPNAGPKPSR